MKQPRFLISLAVILLLGVLLFAEHQAVDNLKQQVEHYKTNNQAYIDEADRAAAEIKDLQRQIESLKNVIAQYEAKKGENVAAAEATDGDPSKTGQPAEGKKDKEKNAFSKMMEKMFTDPEMKKAMRSQQQMVLQTMYGDLAKELGLSPDEAKQVMDLLVDRQMAMAGKSMKMLNGDKTDGKGLEDVGKELSASREDYDKQLANILGDDRMAKFNDYERTIGDRAALTQYKQAFSANGMTLDDKQSSGLLDIMKDERSKQPVSAFDPGNKDIAGQMKALQSDDAFDKALSSQESLNQRVLSRARNVLSADQMTQFEQIQKQQMDMQKMGMKMGRQFMKGGDSAK